MGKPVVLIVAIVAGLLVATVAVAQVTGSEASCRRAIAKQTAKYVKRAHRGIAKCHVSFNAGRQVGDNSVCNDPSANGGQALLAVQAARLRVAIASSPGKCAPGGTPLTNVLALFGRCPAPSEAVDDGGATDGIDDFFELADCLVAQADHLVEQVAVGVLGVPELPLNKDRQKCHRKVAAAQGKLLSAIARSVAKCQASLDRQGGSLGFDCAGTDPNGKIAALTVKLKAKIDKACDRAEGNPRGWTTPPAGRIAGLGLCAEDATGVASCTVQASERFGRGLAAMAWELRGTCPASARVSITPSVTGIDFDAGYASFRHDALPVVDYEAFHATFSCDADCANCVAAPQLPAQACRCSEDAGVVCVTNADCTQTCECFLHPPQSQPIALGICQTMVADGSPTLAIAPLSQDFSLDVPVRLRLYLPESFANPCPGCEAGICSGGARAGLPCSVSGQDVSFGGVSYDCPPEPQNLAAFGDNLTTSRFTTGAISVPASLPCAYGMACPCGLCSGDPLRACASDAECSAAGSGTCTAVAPSEPNNCSGLVCTPDVDDPSEGRCLGDQSSFCDGSLLASGRGVVACVGNSDCTTGVGGGTCTLVQDDECYLDPVEARGTPGRRMAGFACANVSEPGWFWLGSMGPHRWRENIRLDLFCSDGVTPFEPPGGSNCP